jgi:outer membrane receptor protein involved in Fe transport
LADGRLLAATELQHYDGPFVTADDARKVNTVLRYSAGNETNGYSVTGMLYHQLWTNTTDIPLRAIANQISAGLLMREDILRVGRLPTADQVPLSSANDPPSFYDDDQVYLFAGAAYVQAITYWTENLRSVLGMREDFQHGTDVDYLAALHETDGYSNGGTVQQGLPQPKGSLIYAMNPSLEFYASAGRGFHSADIRGVNQDTSVDLGLPHTALLARQEGQEVGVRATPTDALTATFAVYNLWQQSETILDPDVGQDSAGPPSRRYGFELNLTFQINRWLEFYGSVSGNHTRFTRPFDDGTGHEGTYITNAPSVTGSLALYLSGFRPWSGGLNSHAPAAEFWYVDRLQGEVGTYPEGRADIHEHPLEPLMARLTLTKTF